MVQAEQICAEWRGSEWERVRQKRLMQSAEGWSYSNSRWLCTYTAHWRGWKHICLHARMHSGIANSRVTSEASCRLCLKHLHISLSCWSAQWHPVPLTPTSVPVPFPLALWLADRYTAPGCPKVLWGNEIQMPQYLRYHCPTPVLKPVAVKQQLGHGHHNGSDKTTQYVINRGDCRHPAEDGFIHNHLDINSCI